MWKHVPATYGPPKTLYHRWKRWHRMGVFATIMAELAAEKQETEIVMIDATHAKARMASCLAVQKGGPNDKRGRLIGRTKGGLNSKLNVLADAKGRPIRMFLSAGQTSDCIGVRALLASIPQAAALMGIEDTMRTGSTIDQHGNFAVHPVPEKAEEPDPARP